MRACSVFSLGILPQRGGHCAYAREAIDKEGPANLLRRARRAVSIEGRTSATRARLQRACLLCCPTHPPGVVLECVCERGVVLGICARSRPVGEEMANAAYTEGWCVSASNPQCN